jgi:hypothetical protein
MNEEQYICDGVKYVGDIAHFYISTFLRGVSSAMMHGLLAEACNFLCLYLSDPNKDAVLQIRSVGLT